MFQSLQVLLPRDILLHPVLASGVFIKSFKFRISDDNVTITSGLRKIHMEFWSPFSASVFRKFIAWGIWWSFNQSIFPTTTNRQLLPYFLQEYLHILLEDIFLQMTQYFCFMHDSASAHFSINGSNLETVYPIRGKDWRVKLLDRRI